MQASGENALLVTSSYLCLVTNQQETKQSRNNKKSDN